MLEGEKKTIRKSMSSQDLHVSPNPHWVAGLKGLPHSPGTPARIANASNMNELRTPQKFTHEGTRWPSPIQNMTHEDLHPFRGPPQVTNDAAGFIRQDLSGGVPGVLSGRGGSLHKALDTPNDMRAFINDHPEWSHVYRAELRDIAADKFRGSMSPSFSCSDLRAERRLEMKQHVEEQIAKHIQQPSVPKPVDPLGPAAFLAHVSRPGSPIMNEQDVKFRGVELQRRIDHNEHLATSVQVENGPKHVGHQWTDWNNEQEQSKLDAVYHEEYSNTKKKPLRASGNPVLDAIMTLSAADTKIPKKAKTRWSDDMYRERIAAAGPRMFDALPPATYTELDAAPLQSYMGQPKEKRSFHLWRVTGGGGSMGTRSAISLQPQEVNAVAAQMDARREESKKITQRKENVVYYLKSYRDIAYCTAHPHAMKHSACNPHASALTSSLPDLLAPPPATLPRIDLAVVSGSKRDSSPLTVGNSLLHSPQANASTLLGGSNNSNYSSSTGKPLAVRVVNSGAISNVQIASIQAKSPTKALTQRATMRSPASMTSPVNNLTNGNKKQTSTQSPSSLKTPKSSTKNRQLTLNNTESTQAPFSSSNLQLNSLRTNGFLETPQ